MALASHRHEPAVHPPHPPDADASDAVLTFDPLHDAVRNARLIHAHTDCPLWTLPSSTERLRVQGVIATLRRVLVMVSSMRGSVEGVR